VGEYGEKGKKEVEWGGGVIVSVGNNIVGNLKVIGILTERRCVYVLCSQLTEEHK
jgi:hypothetical protein